MPFTKLPYRKQISIGILITVLILISKFSIGQEVVKLKDVNSIVLIMKGYILSNNYLRVEIVKENNVWKCYQTRLRKDGINGLVDDSVRTFIKQAPKAMLEQLLLTVAKKDTGININLFELNKEELLHTTDSLYVNLNSDQRILMINALQSDSVLKYALYKALHPMPMDDKTHYRITINSNNNNALTIGADSFASLYYLPWHIGGVENYNPHISLIFEYLSANNARFVRQQRMFLNQHIVRNVYWSLFHTYK
jgi:hypothetical protein